MTRFANLKKVTTLAFAIAVGFGATNAARAANVLADAVLEVTDFQIQTTAGVIKNILDFTNPIIADFGTNTASLTGFAPGNANGTASGGAAMDIAQVCLGVVCPGANDFTHTVPPVVAGNQLARSDSKLDGAPVDGLTQPPGANARTVAEVQLTGAATGAGKSSLGLNTSFTFTLAQATALRFTFLADLYLRAFLSADAPLGSFAQATSALSFSIDDSLGNTVFEWAPNGRLGAITGGTEIADGTNLNTTVPALVAGDNNFRDVAGSQRFTADTDPLGVGSYRFSINHVVGADATQAVPEPGTLLLAGGALLGLALSRRGRKAA